VKNIYWLFVMLAVIGLWYIVNPLAGRYVLIANQSPCVAEDEEGCLATNYYIDSKTGERIEVKDFPGWIKYFGRIKTLTVF